MENNQNIPPGSSVNYSLTKRKIIILASVLVALVVVCFFVFLKLNSKYQKNKLENISINISSTTPYCVANNCYPEIDISGSVSQYSPALKFFSDSRFGFEFKYPQEWDIKGEEYILTHTKRISLSYPKGTEQAVNSLPASYSNWDQESKLLEVGTTGLTVSMAFEVDKNRNPNQLPVREWFNKEFNNGKNFSSTPTINQDVKVNGIDAIKIAVPDMGTQVVYYIPVGPDIITAIYTESKKYDPVYNQIISSLKFISSQSSMDIKDWKIYNNSKYSFTFKYPDDGFIGNVSTDEFARIQNFSNDKNGSLKDGEYYIEIYALHNYEDSCAITEIEGEWGSPNGRMYYGKVDKMRYGLCIHEGIGTVNIVISEKDQNYNLAKKIIDSVQLGLDPENVI